MKKIFVILFLIVLLSCISSLCLAQEEEQSLPLRFPSLFYREHFEWNNEQRYYRFPTIRPLFDPFDLGYFPHDRMWEWDWSVLRRKDYSGVYEQTVLLSKPAENQVTHGTEINKDFGAIGDFYLYADLFAADTYPAGAGSCYVYFSDSILQGLLPSRGILFDPSSGIYRVENSFKQFFYEPSQGTHKMTLMKELDPEDYPLPDDISLSTYAAPAFDPAVDEQFLADWETVRSAYRMEGSPEVKAWRLEVIREGFISDFYVNGKRVVRMFDFINKTDEDGNEVPDKVSFSYGPILYKQGITTTCAIGDLYIYGTQKDPEPLGILVESEDDEDDLPKKDWSVYR